MQKGYVLFRRSVHHYFCGIGFCEAPSGAKTFSSMTDVLLFATDPKNQWLVREEGLEVHAVQFSAEDLGRV